MVWKAALRLSIRQRRCFFLLTVKKKYWVGHERRFPVTFYIANILFCKRFYLSFVSSKIYFRHDWRFTSSWIKNKAQSKWLGWKAVKCHQHLLLYPKNLQQSPPSVSTPSYLLVQDQLWAHKLCSKYEFQGAKLWTTHVKSNNNNNTDIMLIIHK